METITNNIQLSNLALTLRRLRIESGLSFKKLAKLTGISADDLFDIERDFAIPSGKILDKLAKVYKVEASIFNVEVE